MALSAGGSRKNTGYCHYHRCIEEGVELAQNPAQKAAQEVTPAGSELPQLYSEHDDRGIWKCRELSRGAYDILRFDLPLPSGASSHH